MNDRVYASIQIRVEAWQVELTYSYTHNGRPAELVRQSVMLETTPCTLGGGRQWFCCPMCARRVAVIYGRGSLFGCRQCKGLANASQAEADDDRAARRAERIRKQLGWPPGILNGPGGKPRGMRWSTYARLFAAHAAFVGISLAGMAKKLGMLRGRLEEIEIQSLYAR